MKKAPLILFFTAIGMLRCCMIILTLRNNSRAAVLISDLPEQTTQSIPVQTAPPIFPVDINTADLAQLMQLPGIGKTYAQCILDYRDTHGSFTDISQLLNVPGIGQRRLDAIIPYITIGGTHEDTGC